MANLKIRSGAIEMTATGGADFIGKERDAFYDFLKHKIGEDVLAAKERREKLRNKIAEGMEKAVEAAGEYKEAVSAASAACKVPENGDVLQGVHVGTCPATYNMRAYKQMYITPEMLRTNKAAGKLDELLHPFDEIDVPLTTGGTVTVVCGYVTPTTARFVFKDCWDEHVMNEENTNKTGYFKSAARKHILEDILPNIAPEWREIIVPRTIVEIIDGERVEYNDALWMPSATDVFGTPEGAWWKDEGDDFQLPIFKRERDRVKECGDEGTYPWWLRSVDATTAYSFCIVGTDGGAYNNRAYYSRGFAPGFDI